MYILRTTDVGRRLDSNSTAHTHGLATHVAPPSTPPCYTCRTRAAYTRVPPLAPLADSAKRSQRNKDESINKAHPCVGRVFLRPDDAINAERKALSAT